MFMLQIQQEHRRTPHSSCKVPEGDKSGYLHPESGEESLCEVLLRSRCFCNARFGRSRLYTRAVPFLPEENLPLFFCRGICPAGQAFPHHLSFPRRGCRAFLPPRPQACPRARSVQDCAVIPVRKSGACDADSPAQNGKRHQSPHLPIIQKPLFL